MKSRAIACCCAVAVLLSVAAPAFAASDADPFGAPYSLIRRGTPEWKQAISRLKEARYVDWMNAQSFFGGVNGTAGTYYYQKAQEANTLMWRLHEGRPVFAYEVRKALDTSDAWRFGGTL